MTWWEQPHDICFASRQNSASDLKGFHYPQPSEPEDFSSAPKFVIHDFTVIPDGDILTYSEGVFTIGQMRYKTGEGYDLMLEPLHLWEIGPNP